MAKRRMGKIIVFLVICLCIHIIPYQAYATSTADAKEPITLDNECSLTVSCICAGTAFSGSTVKLYKIADVSADYQYSPTSSFESSRLVLNGVQTHGEWNVIRSTLETHILAEKLREDLACVTDSNGRAYFEALTPGLYLATAERMTTDEKVCVFDSALIALPALDADGFWQYHVDVSPKSKAVLFDEIDKEMEFKVLKLWKDANNTVSRPENIEVEIFCNGSSYQTVLLSEDNHWTYTWTAKADGLDWKVVERNIPSGYTATVEERGTTFTLTNTLTEETSDTPTAPKTGDTSNIMFYVILLSISGCMLIILGIALKRVNV